MAVTRSNNVIKITADNDTVAGPLRIKSVKYKAGSSTPSVQMKVTDTNGMIMWETANATDVFEEICLNMTDTLHVDMAGTGTALYLYLE